MLGQRVMIPTAGNAEIALDQYIPEVHEELDLNIRRQAVVICPGGGYVFLSHREAEPVALNFAAAGFNVFVVWYRFAPHRYPLPQQDAAAAVAWVRAHAEQTHTDPDRIAILGFSAGGHLAGSLGTLWQRGDLWRGMGLKPEDVRPNAMVLCYPVITGGEYAHRGSFAALTGSGDLGEHERFSVDGWVTDQCPPTFLWHTDADELVPVQNSLMMAQACAKHHIVTELHIFPYGGHGTSLCNEITSLPRDPSMILPDCAAWPQMAQSFLRRVM